MTKVKLSRVAHEPAIIVLVRQFKGLSSLCITIQTSQVLAQGSATAEQLAALRDELLAAVPSAPDLAPLRDDLLSLSQRTEAQRGQTLKVCWRSFFV